MRQRLNTVTDQRGRETLNHNSTARIPDLTSKTIAFIGGGNMSASLIGGLIADGYKAKRIIASDPDGEKLAGLAARFGIITAPSNDDAVSRADVVLLAVKPQMMKEWYWASQNSPEPPPPDRLYSCRGT